jgi:hypothetical protein
MSMAAAQELLPRLIQANALGSIGRNAQSANLKLRARWWTSCLSADPRVVELRKIIGPGQRIDFNSESNQWVGP